MNSNNRIAATLYSRDIVCLRNISINILHEGYDDDDDNNNNNNNNNLKGKTDPETEIIATQDQILQTKCHRQKYYK